MPADSAEPAASADHADATEPAPSFPRLYARTQRFTLGEPRNLTITADGRTVLFVRTADGTSRSGLLWAFDVETGTERLLADPTDLLGGADEHLSPEERARRERAREAAGGIVNFTVDDAGRTVTFALSGTVWACAVDGSGCRRLPTVGAAIDPRIDPTGTWVAYGSERGLRRVRSDGSDERLVVGPEPGHDTVVWGQADFIEAEEMDRTRGFWWAPDGRSLLVERYDEAPVRRWYIADPADPAASPIEHRYPVAGSDEAIVELWHVEPSGRRTRIRWDAHTFPYLARVSWTTAGALVEVVSRDQKRALTLGVDTESGGTTVLAEVEDPSWVELVDGVPTFTPDGRLVTTIDDPDTDTRRLAIDGVPVSPPGLQIRGVIQVGDDGVLVSASDEPVDTRCVCIGADGSVIDLVPDREGGSGATVSGRSTVGTEVVVSSDLEGTRSRVIVRRQGIPVGSIESLAVEPDLRPRVTIVNTGPREIRTAVLFPSDHVPRSRRLPVLMAPYGGPHGQLVRSSARMFLQAQWLADQGFAVVVADGRGTPVRGPNWEKAVRDAFATVTLDDQVDALAGVADRFPDDVDTGRVGIMGWSYGGYLAALAVLERPDVFHAAVAGAPVTDWTLYDTYYTERYLGDPNRQPQVYEQNSLIRLAPQLRRPLLIVHGMADDNVVVAHTLRLSSALLAAGRPHSVLPLTGVTHMASQEQIAENLLLAQVRFLTEALRSPAPEPA